MLRSIVILFLISLVSLSYSQETKTNTREGFVFGASTGLAHTIQSFPTEMQRDTDFGLGLKIGYMIKPNLAILLTSNVSSYNYSGSGRARKRDFGIVAPAIQYWFLEKVWILGGVCLGVDAPIFFDIKDPDLDKEEIAYYGGLGAVGALGYDFYQGKRFVLDLKVRVTYRNVNLPEGNVKGISTAVLIGVDF